MGEDNGQGKVGWSTRRSVLDLPALEKTIPLFESIDDAITTMSQA
jgi:hypothetical protein